MSPTNEKGREKDCNKIGGPSRSSRLRVAFLVSLLLIMNIRIKIPARKMNDFAAAIKFRFKQVACKFVTLTEAGFTKMGIGIESLYDSRIL